MVHEIWNAPARPTGDHVALLSRWWTGPGMAIDTDRIDDCVLALLLLGRHDGQRVWKSFDWDAMDRLHKMGLISDPVGRAKSVVLTTKGSRERSSYSRNYSRKNREQEGGACKMTCGLAAR
jgi:hypothetical protein